VRHNIELSRPAVSASLRSTIDRLVSTIQNGHLRGRLQRLVRCQPTACWSHSTKVASLTSLPTPSTRAICWRAVVSYLHQRRFPVYFSRPALIGGPFFLSPQYLFFTFLRTEQFFCAPNIELSCAAESSQPCMVFKDACTDPVGLQGVNCSDLLYANRAIIRLLGIALANQLIGQWRLFFPSHS